MSSAIGERNDGFSRGEGSYEGWGGYLGDVNDNDQPGSPTGAYSAVERSPGTGSVTGYYEGRDLDGNGTVERDEFSPTSGLNTNNPVGVVDADLCCFHANLPSPIEAPRSLNLHPDQGRLNAYRGLWYHSALRDSLTDYAYRRVSFVLTRTDSPSMFVPTTRTVYISLADLNSHGIVAIDHELMHAGLKLGRMDGLITKQQYNRLNRLSTRRFSNLNGYVGTIRGLFNPRGFGAAKAFVVGHQYAKLKRVRGQLPDLHRAAADKFISDVDNNVHLGRLADGTRVRLISSPAGPAKIDSFLSEFTTPGTATAQEIAEVLANYPAPPPPPTPTPTYQEPIGPDAWGK